MSDTTLIELKEFPEQFLNELRSGNEHSVALIEFLKDNFSCDFSNVDDLLALPEMRAAIPSLIEKSTPSSYSQRLHTKAFINNDALASGQSNFWLVGPKAGSNYAIASAPIPFVAFEGDPDNLFSDRTPSTFTMRSGGMYTINFSGLIAACAADASAVAVVSKDTTEKVTAALPVGGVSADPVDKWAGAPIDIVLAITSGSTTRYKTLATALFYPSDYTRFRSRIVAGNATLTLVAGSVISLIFQRRAQGATMVNQTTTASRGEALAFNKSVVVIPGSPNPTRDGYNYLDIMRIT